MKSGETINISMVDKLFSIEDVRKSSVRSYGLFHLYSHMAQRIGLIDALRFSIPQYWMELFMLACFMAATGKRSLTLVMDKGFFSAKNVNYLMDSTQHEPMKFLISIPFTSAFAKKQVEYARNYIQK